jgi:hypothetical protein
MLELLSSLASSIGGSHILALTTGAFSLVTGGVFAKAGVKSVAVALLVIAASIFSGWTGHRITHDAWMTERAEMLAAEARERALAEQRYAKLSADYEAGKARRNVVYRTVYRNADAWVAAHPDAACLDPGGLRILNEAIAGSPAGAGQLDGALRTGHAAR